MKSYITKGCALALGLMAFAASKAQADNIVIDNTLYAPMNAKVTVQYVDKNKVKQATGNAKDLLNWLGYDTGKVKLALGPGTNDRDMDVYVVNKANGSVIDVSTNYDTSGYYMVVAKQMLIGTTNMSSNLLHSQWTENGQVFVLFYGADTKDGEVNFSLSGTYAAKGGENDQKNSNVYTENISFKSSNLSGTGTVAGFSTNDLPATGSLSGGGSGKLTAVVN